MQTLPIHSHFEEIAKLLESHQVILVAGETGSGKSTQLPQLCYQLFKDKPGLIGHTQPRRIAAKTIAARIADEMQTPLGQIVGYQMRFNESVSPATRIKLMTDGILLAEMRDDPLLKRYQVLIIDEAHERSLNIDFILGYLKQILSKRTDLKVIITSATLDHERLAQHFKAPVVLVEGRTYPIEIRYQALNSKKDTRDALYSGVVQGVMRLQKEVQGDILVFLPTEREIREFRKRLQEHFTRYEVLPLYARLPLSAQQKIFHHGVLPRIILATNVAETSITVPNVRYVIDSGMARVSRFHAKLRIQRLPIEAISQANAKQRAGRAGRTAEGIAIRLYEEEDFLNRSDFLEPELLRTNLAAVILMMLKNQLGDIENFPFIDPPPGALVHEGYKELLALQAIEGDRGHYHLTQIGRRMSEFPLDPRLARMLIGGQELRVLPEILIIVSNLTTQDPREYPEEELEKAKARHQRYQHPESEFITLLNLWTIVHTETQGLSNNQFKRYCEKHYLSHNRMREWQALHHELVEKIPQSLRDSFLNKGALAQYQFIHQALLTGSLHFIGFYDDEKQCYRGAENKLFQIFPGSYLAKKKFKWLMAESLMETQRVYARIVARIEANWLEPISRHLVKKQYSEPTYDSKMDEVIAYETVLLYGLPIVTRRKTLYAKKNPQLAREIFIREGIIPNETETQKEELENWEAKLRRVGICFTDEEAYAFYNKTLPTEAVSFKTLETPIPAFDISDKLKALEPLSEDYPDEWMIAGEAFRLLYKFDPLDSEDGVTVQVYLQDLPTLPDTLGDWLPKGPLREKITVMIRELPKSTRKLFMPIPETAQSLIEKMQAVPVSQSLASFLAQQLREQLREEDFYDLEIPDYLQLKIDLFNEEGEFLASETSLKALKHQFAEELHALVNQAYSPFDETIYTDWSFEDLPPQIENAYPALFALPEGVQIQLYPDHTEALGAHMAGVLHLAKLHYAKELKALKSDPKILNELSKLTFIQDKANLIQEFLDYALLHFFETQDQELKIIRTRTQFKNLLALKPKFYGYQQDLLKWLQHLTAPLLEIRVKLKGLSHKQGLAESCEDLQAQFLNLCTPHFFAEVPHEFLQRYPTYLKGMQLRIERLLNNPERELRLFTEFKPIRQKAQPRADLRWMLEEYRLSLFAQELKTLMPISTKKMRDLL